MLSLCFRREEKKMHFKKFNLFKIFVFLLLSIFLFSSLPQSSDRILVKIPKRQENDLPRQLLPEIRAVQELDTCWITETSSFILSELEKIGISHEVLDTDLSGKSYFLVFVPSSAHLELLSNLGNVRVVENQTCLFWTTHEDVREVLPADFEIKRLPSQIPLPLRLESIPAREIRREEKLLRLARLNPRISLMVSQVSKENLSSFIQALQDFQTRYASTPNCEYAGTYIYNYFTQLGIQSEYDSFTFSSNYSSRNIIGVLPGKTAPDCVVIVCGHYDSYSTNRFVLAPGADDNASGTAAVMEMARIMRGESFDFTLKFICFSAEEWGLYGSKHYAQEAKQKREKIIGVINMDMIGYADRLPEDLNLFVNQNSDWLGNKYILAANAYVPLEIQKTINASMTYSDHAPFWDQGYSALLGIEDYPLNNPYYHKTDDTLNKLNMDFATTVTRASLAAAADLAQPESAPAAPSGVTAHSQVSSSLFSSTKTTFLNWKASGGQIAGYNIYRTSTSHANYKKINSTLVTKTSYADYFLTPSTAYYYVITAVDSQNRESNYSEEVRDDENNTD